MIPIDKAANNIAFVCKRFYAKVLLNEFGILGIPNPTYINLSNSDSQDIINEDVIKIKRIFNIDTNANSKILPSPYWLPKMHKSPIGSRFIIASKVCSIKELSKKR